MRSMVIVLLGLALLTPSSVLLPVAHAAASPTHLHLAPVAMFKCPICLQYRDQKLLHSSHETVNNVKDAASELIQLRCQCIMCIGCLRTFIDKHPIKAAGYLLRCPLCTWMLTPALIDRLCSVPDLLRHWRARLSLLRNDILAETNNYLYQVCPTPDCYNIYQSTRPLIDASFRLPWRWSWYHNNIYQSARHLINASSWSWWHWSSLFRQLDYEVDEDGVDRRQWQCQRCQRTHCAACLAPWTVNGRQHDRLSCKYFRGVPLREIRALSELRRSAQRCPQCQTWITKSEEGCIAMTCAVCAYEFRWIDSLRQLPGAPQRNWTSIWLRFFRG